ncbi:hypothetical protein P3T73_08250 [Kiritimatiellota bacterium B12222]|nr:hypothetical protein P3T73_08250 [Kiritimatiellota bacterium B12222]
MIHEYNHRFDCLLESLPLALCIFSDETTQEIAKINSSFYTLFGYTQKDIPTSKDWLTHAYPDRAYRKQAESEWQKSLRYLSSTQTRPPPLETRVTCKNGTSKNISWGFASANETYYAYAFDFTEQKKTAETLALHQARLEQEVLDRTKELRQIVNVMAGRENRMMELKRTISQLCEQLTQAGITPQDLPAEENTPLIKSSKARS